MDKDLQDFENRQRLFISQRLEKHSKDISEYVDKKVNESERRIISYVDQKSAEVLNASAEAHKEILARLERIESRLE